MIEKKKRNKLLKKSLVIINCFLIIIFILSNININIVKGTENYSNYLFEHEIEIHSDKAMILNELSDSSNNYRNTFDSGFLFPSKLSNEMFNAYANDYTQYSLSQIYLDKLNDDYSFMSNDNSENLITEQEINVSDTDLNYGNSDNFLTNYSYNLIPNDDVSCNWGHSGVGDHYEDIDEYPSINTLDYIYVDSIMDGYTESLGFSDLPNPTLYFDTLEVKIYLWVSLDCSDDMKIELYNGVEYFAEKTISIDYFETEYWENNTWDDLGIPESEIDNLEIRITAPSSITAGGLEIYTIAIKINNSLDLTRIQSNWTQGNTGTFPATYSFTDDSIGGNPIDWTLDEGGGTVDVIAEIDGHSNVVEQHDTSGSYDVGMYNVFSNQEYGQIEFWIRTTDDTKSSWIDLMESGTYGFLVGFYNGNLYYYDGTYHLICSTNNNQWYHIRIEFECGAGNHFGLSADHCNVFVDSIEYSDLSYDTGLSNVNKLQFRTSGSHSGYYFYIDAIGYEWDSEYSINDNLYDEIHSINLDIERDISYLNISGYKPVFYDIYFEICFNETIEIPFQLYNYDTEIYTNMELIDDVNSFNLKTYRFNESSHYRLNKFRQLINVNFTNNFTLYIKTFSLNITYVLENNLGCHDIFATFHKEKDDTTYTGYDTFYIKLYNNSFSYRYQEINFFANNYTVGWLNYDFEQEIETFEINYHIRYGLNTLDVEITNLLIQIYINSELELTFIEQDRIYFESSHYRPQFNYTCNNHNYLNITGVYGNYSCNNLAGIRCLRGQNNEIYNRFFEVPLYSYEIDVAIASNPSDSIAIMSEPAPPSSYYWTYETFRLKEGTTISTNVGNWSVDFTQLDIEQYTAKYFYEPYLIQPRYLGDWTIRFGDYFKVSFNFFRDTICFIINTIFVFLQYFMYLVTASFSYIFMFIGCLIMLVLWNIAFYYLYIGICYIGWYIIVGLIYIWELLIWVWETFLLPFLSWFWNTIIPILIDWFIMWIAFCLTCLVYIITLGQIDFNETYAYIYETLWIIVIEIYNWIITFFNNIIFIMLFVVWYLICILYLYFRYLIARARGFDTKAQKYYYTLTFFFAPFMLIINWIKGSEEIAPVI